MLAASSQALRLSVCATDVQPLCSPTRGTIMTGRYPSHTGIGPNVIRPVHAYAMPKREVMLPEVLKAAGYATHMVGKWHVSAVLCAVPFCADTALAQLGYCVKEYSPTYRCVGVR